MKYKGFLQTGLRLPLICALVLTSLLLVPQTVAAQPDVITSSLPDGFVGATYIQDLQLEGGVPPYFWTLEAGTLPDGLSLSDEGTISGTPTTPGVFDFTVQVMDGEDDSDSQMLAIEIPSGIENLSRLAGVTTNVSSHYSGFPGEMAIDGDLITSWFTEGGDAANLGTEPFVEVILAADAVVTRIHLRGNREPADGHDFFRGRFDVFDAADGLLGSEEADLPAPWRDVQLNIPDQSGVRRVRFTSLDDESDEPGLAEFEVIGSPWRPDLRIIDVWSDGSTVHYQLRNIGEAAVPGGHFTALSVNGEQEATDTLDANLAPGERLNRSFLNYNWVCTSPEDTIKVEADYGGDVTESDETNNSREETWRCDTSSPVISGLNVSQITETSAVISWSTDEDSDSALYHGKQAGEYDGFERDATFTQSHQMTLSSLEPSTLYHYKVRSTDAGGYQRHSEEDFFETAPSPDDQAPTVSSLSFRREGLLDRYKIWVPFTDTTGIGRVEFYLGDTLIGTDYSDSPSDEPGESLYQTSLSPTLMGMNRSQFFIDNNLTAKAFSHGGSWNSVVQQFGPLRENMPVDLEFLSPDPDHTLYTEDARVLIANVVEVSVRAVEYEWECEWIGGDTEHSPSCGDVASPVPEVEFYIDDTLIETVLEDGDFTFTSGWDFYNSLAGTRTFRVVARASDGGEHEIERTVTIIQGEPSLNVRRVVGWENNYIYVRLIVENHVDALSTAYVDRVVDYVNEFQPIHKTTENYVLTSSYPTWVGSFERRNTIDIDLFTDTADAIALAPGEEFTIEYLVVPILYEDGESDPVIGDLPTRVYYEYAGQSAMETFSRRFSPWTTVNAIGEADYLMVTNPKLLLQFYAHDEVNTLLSTMAHLAQLKQGVLGYLDTYDKYLLDDLVEPGGYWAESLHPNFKTTLGGYLLIVGEIEIVPAWYSSWFDLCWEPEEDDWFCHDDPHSVPYHDQSYANTSGSMAPELIVGRIIGSGSAILSSSWAGS